MSSCTIATQKKRTQAEHELQASAATVAEELEAHPESDRARLFADLFVAVLGQKAPPLLSRHRRAALEDVASARAEGLPYIASMLWRRLIELDALDQARGRALAPFLGALVESPVVVFHLEDEARSLGLEETASQLANALDRRFPEFRAESERMRIDRDLLAGAGIDLSKLDAEFYGDGHLRRLSRRGAKSESPTLELDAIPGRGRYGETGRRGGYGFLVSERFEEGHAVGTFFSPWHDGADYRTKKPWLVWVRECAGEIAKEKRPAA